MLMNFSLHNQSNTTIIKTVKLYKYIFTHLPYFLFKGSFLILMIDDFHNINTIQTPQGRQLSNAVHMATLLIDIQNEEPVKRQASNHREVIVTANGREPQVCKGGICSDAVIQEISNFWYQYCVYSFLENAPAHYRDMNPRILQKSLKEIRYQHNLYMLSIP